MISFQRLLGREREFCDLFEASAEEGCHAVAALKRILCGPKITPTLHEFADARSKNKKVTEEISEMLITTFVTPMEREDIASLATTLYKIPKTVEKFAERYLISQDQIGDADFSKQVDCMEQAVDLVREMVRGLRGGRKLAELKGLQNRLQQLESEADDLLLELMRPFYRPGFPALKAVILKDLYDLNEKVVDRCRDAGNTISHVVLKNS